MIDSFFFLCITVSFLSYGVQMPLMVHYVRKYDGLVVTVIRNLSLTLTMSPFLFLATGSEIAEVWVHIPTILFASFLGTLSFIAALNASKYIPVGITYATRQVIYVALTMICGYLFFMEALSPIQTVLLVCMISAGTMLALIKSQHTHLNPHTAWKGISLALFAGVFHAGTFYFFTDVARQMNPLVASYFWEVFVGVFALLLFYIQRTFTSYDSTLAIPWKDMRYIVIIGLLTLSGTGGYSIAVNYGPFALASGLVTLSTVVAMVVAWVLFKEKLSRVHVALILCIVGLLIAIKVVS